jgi:hypothetical protein
MRDPKERLRDILEAIAAIDRYRNRDRRVFEQMVMGFWSSAAPAQRNPALFSEALRDACRKPISPPRTLIGWMLPRL